MEIVVRAATPDDAEAIVGVLNPIIEEGVYTAFDTPFTAEAERDYLQSLRARSVFHVAVTKVDHEVVGFQNLQPFADYTHAFDHVATIGTFVDLRYRHRGISTALFRETLPAAVRIGYEKIFTFVRADNPTALHTYTGQGFRIVGTSQRQAKVDGRYIDEVIIEKLL